MVLLQSSLGNAWQSIVNKSKPSQLLARTIGINRASLNRIFSIVRVDDKIIARQSLSDSTPMKHCFLKTLFLV